MHAAETAPGGLRRRWTVYLLHHAHTDIGYTDPQDTIRRRHIDYIDQALEIHQRAQSGDETLRGFKWNSECFWSIECWLRANSTARHALLLAAIRDGAFGISGTYLHFTELLDQGLSERMLGRSTRFARSLGLPLDTAISADVNGFGWGYAQALHDHGITHFIVCPHNAHGRAPIGERQQPFYWETPRGDRIWVWLGEHYLLGNILGLAPGALLNYDHTPDVTFPPRFGEAAAVAAERLPLYLSRLEQRGHPFDFAAVHLSGMMSDNAPPNENVIRFVHEWNRRNGHKIRLEMCTASEFAHHARAAYPDAPTYRGDWPDWWSDGVASSPQATRHFRRAQASYACRRALAQRFDVPIASTEVDDIDTLLALYAEHTFGHAHSVQSPWGLDTTVLHDAKSAYAVQAYQAVATSLEQAQQALGKPTLRANRGAFYRVLNPHARRHRDLARLVIEHCDQEFPEHVEVIEHATGKAQAHRVVAGASGRVVETILELAPAESHRLLLRATAHPPTPGDGISTQNELASPFVHIGFSLGRGIKRWDDKLAGVSLLQPHALHAAFTPVQDVTPAAKPLDGTQAAALQMATRGSLQLNRKGTQAIHTDGVLHVVRPLAVDSICAATQLIYRVPGCAFFEVELCAWLSMPRVDATIRLLKLPSWDTENLYVSLPFCADAECPGELWIDKAGAVLRPSQDLLPGALTDFTCVQSGFARVRPERGTVVTTLDAPLLQLGSLAAGPRRFAGETNPRPSNDSIYGWLLTNFWETNFTADTGGFHEFCYRIEWGPHLRSPEECFALSQALREGLSSFRCVAP